MKPRPHKIALLTDWYGPKVGGIEQQLHGLALHLLQEGHEVHVLTPVPGSEWMDGVQVHRLDVPLYRFIRLSWHPKAFRQMASIMERERYDIVHCHASLIAPVAFGGAYLARRLGIPVVVTFHSILGLFTRVMTGLDRVTRWSSWPVVFSAVSDVVARDLCPLVAPRKIHMLPNACDPSFWQVAPLSRNGKGIRIVTVMRMSPQKRGKALLRMIQKLGARVGTNTPVKLTIVGDGIQRRAMDKAVSRLGLENTVDIVGYRSHREIRRYFEEADIFVMPSRRESFGLAALEARCAGLPVVGMKESGLSEFIREGREGLLASSDREMVERLAELIRSPDLRSSIARHNRETAPPYDWQRSISKHMELYRMAMGKIDSPDSGGSSVHSPIELEVPR